MVQYNLLLSFPLRNCILPILILCHAFNFYSSLCDCLFIEMEFCEKGTLADWMIEKSGTERCKDSSLMKFQQIVEGVAYIHSKELIHRDLKVSK